MTQFVDSATVARPLQIVSHLDGAHWCRENREHSARWFNEEAFLPPEKMYRNGLAPPGA
jgi:hypothetical protein